MGEGERGGGEADEGGYEECDYVAVKEGEYWVEGCEEGEGEVWGVGEVIGGEGMGMGEERK